MKFKIKAIMIVIRSTMIDQIYDLSINALNILYL